MNMSHVPVPQAHNRVPRAAESARQESLYLELERVLLLVNNLLHCSRSCKQAAIELGIARVFGSIWPTCMLDDRAMRALLETLCNLVALCPDAARALSRSPPGESTPILRKAIIHARRLIQQGCNVRNPVLCALLALLSSAVLTSACCETLVREGFVESAITDVTQRPAYVSALLPFLANASLTDVCQQAMLRHRAFVTWLIERLPGSAEEWQDNNDFSSTERLVLMVVRNLCFFRGNKSTLLANRRFTSALSDAARFAADDVSARWGLEGMCALISFW